MGILQNLQQEELTENCLKQNNFNAANVLVGKSFSPIHQIAMYDPDEWESFTAEWLFSQKDFFGLTKILKISGANDMGIDVAGFKSDKGYKGEWLNFQCKHYEKQLTPTTAYLEIGKILWYSFKKHYTPPLKYYFIAPKGCGMSLSRLLLDSSSILENLKMAWDKNCKTKITTQETIELKGDFLKYVENFDYTIFTFKNPEEMINEHQTSRYHVARFGGGLNPRPQVGNPPSKIQDSESKYIHKLLSVYEEKIGIPITDYSNLQTHPKWDRHFKLHREYFYHSESLRNFARDNVPIGTFDDLKDEIFAGVIDVNYEEYDSKLNCLSAVLTQSTNLNLISNPLMSVVKMQDRKGICHQLANEDKLEW